MRRYRVALVNDPVDELTYDKSTGPRNQQEYYQITKATLNKQAPLLIDKPIRLNHKASTYSGTVVHAYVDPIDNRMICEFEMDSSRCGSGIIPILIQEGIWAEASMSHDKDTLEPVEVSIVEKGGREGCIIEEIPIPVPPNQTVTVSNPDNFKALEYIKPTLNEQYVSASSDCYPSSTDMSQILGSSHGLGQVPPQQGQQAGQIPVPPNLGLGAPPMGYNPKSSKLTFLSGASQEPNYFHQQPGHVQLTPQQYQQYQMQQQLQQAQQQAQQQGNMQVEPQTNAPIPQQQPVQPPQQPAVAPDTTTQQAPVTAPVATTETPAAPVVDMFKQGLQKLLAPNGIMKSEEKGAVIDQLQQQQAVIEEQKKTLEKLQEERNKEREDFQQHESQYLKQFHQFVTSSLKDKSVTVDADFTTSLDNKLKSGDYSGAFHQLLPKCVEASYRCFPQHLQQQPSSTQPTQMYNQQQQQPQYQQQQAPIVDPHYARRATFVDNIIFGRGTALPQTSSASSSSSYLNNQASTSSLTPSGYAQADYNQGNYGNNNNNGYIEASAASYQRQQQQQQPIIKRGYDNVDHTATNIMKSSSMWNLNAIRALNPATADMFENASKFKSVSRYDCKLVDMHLPETQEASSKRSRKDLGVSSLHAT